MRGGAVWGGGKGDMVGWIGVGEEVSGD